MSLHALAEQVGRIEDLDRIAGPLAKAVKQAVGQGTVKDLLSGSWLGHPLHPLLTDVTIGSLTSATLLDVLAGERGEDAADVLVGIGIASALPTVAAGAADWSDSYGEEMRAGVVHALSNAVGVGLYALSLAARRRGDRGVARALGIAGMTSMSVGGYLGGYLSHSRGVGVNHAFLEHPPHDWTGVLDDGELAEGTPTQVDADGTSVLLYRRDGRIHAIANRCTHAGGPLDEGSVDDESCTVTCPWHQSVFRLQDGGVVHGPASVPQVAFDARVENGRIEVRQR
jgi:nitrite reductase/ring-hydroxylating ferredoxin subunit/uncharacterized membrane protein